MKAVQFVRFDGNTIFINPDNVLYFAKAHNSDGTYICLAKEFGVTVQDDPINAMRKLTQ